MPVPSARLHGARNGLHVDVHGGRGTYLLLVHGFLSSREQWRGNLETLARCSRPVVVELLGHGRSGSPDDPAAYDVEAYVQAFEAIRESLGCERWAICGQSLGAALTLRYALSYPERICAHVFTNSNSALADARWQQGIQRFATEQAESIARSTPDELRRLPIHPANGRRLPAHVKRALVDDAALHDPLGLAHTIRYTTPYSSSRERVNENRVPTLLVVGEREKRFEAQRRHAEQHLPRLQVIGVDAGHAANAELPEEFNAAATRFLAAHSESP